VRSSLALFVAAALGLAPSVASAGGLDLPILYTARHAGAGGTAIAGVSDAASIFHNPAGLAGVHGLSLLGNLSLVFTNLQTNPAYPDENVETGNSVAPAPFLAAAYHPVPLVALGLGVYPVGAVSGTFHYDDINGVPTLNAQNTLAFEVSPGIAFRPVDQLSIGVGYRITVIRFQRQLGNAANPVLVDVDATGVDFTGFRLGAQWRPTPWLSLGIVYRPRIQPVASAAHGHLLGLAASNVQATVVFPAKLGAGVRADLGPVSLAADYEFVWNSQFRSIHLAGDLPGQPPIGADFLFNWSDSSTVKLGAEYRATSNVTLRAGYAWDGVYENLHFPDTFSQPAVPGHYFTLGGGYRGDSWEVNVALALRPDQSSTVRQQDIASQAECRFCTYPGVYASRLDMALIDFSKDFDL
jgi:long-chain fatty acid transport protein